MLTVLQPFTKDSGAQAWQAPVRAGFYRYDSARAGGSAGGPRFAAIRRRVLGALGGETAPLMVADIGCGAGAQCRLWAEHGHRVHGVDLNPALLALARRHAREASVGIAFELAPASALPWPDSSMDVCIAPALLEYVEDWGACLSEMVRVLKPGGVLYISTSNKLCPRQRAFRLPLYAWYPGFIKRRCLRLALGARPELTGFAASPLRNWFSWYGLRARLDGLGMRSLDRVDLAVLGDHGRLARLALSLVRTVPPLRFCTHFMSSETILLAVKG